MKMLLSGSSVGLLQERPKKGIDNIKKESNDNGDDDDDDDDKISNFNAILKRIFLNEH